MRLYSKTGATRIDGPSGSFTPGANGAFDGLPDAVYADLHGRPDWEDEAERTARLAAEQLEKLRDPATMLAELQKMTAGQGELAALLANALRVGQAPAEPEAPVSESDTTPTDEPPPSEDSTPADEPPAPAPTTKSRASKKTASAPPPAA